MYTVFPFGHMFTPLHGRHVTCEGGTAASHTSTHDAQNQSSSSHTHTHTYTKQRDSTQRFPSKVLALTSLFIVYNPRCCNFFFVASTIAQTRVLCPMLTPHSKMSASLSNEKVSAHCLNVLECDKVFHNTRMCHRACSFRLNFLDQET